MVLDSTRRQLAELAPLANRLNQVTDAFTDELRAVEAELARMAIGLNVELAGPLSVDEVQPGSGEWSEPTYQTWHLGYGRFGKEWRLVVRQYNRARGADNSDGMLWQELPLVDASRSVRRAAAERIGELLELLTVNARNKVDALSKVVDRRPLPRGWENFRYAIDEAGTIHVLNDGGDTRCGAPAVSTNFDGTPEERLCGVCSGLMRTAIGRNGGRPRS